MDTKNFKQWLKNEKKYSNKTISSRLSNCKHLDEVYNLDELYKKDNCEELRQELSYSSEDMHQGFASMVDIEIKGDYLKGIRTLKSALNLYVEFLNSTEIKNNPGDKVMHNKCESSPTYKVEYKGDFEKFKRYIGAYCRNKVQSFTKDEKDKHRGICQYCKKSAILESAHKRGEERNELIKKILEDNYKISTDYYDVDLLKFEEDYKNAHMPIEDHFFFLCRQCHRDYDSGKIVL